MVEGGQRSRNRAAILLLVLLLIVLGLLAYFWYSSQQYKQKYEITYKEKQELQEERQRLLQRLDSLRNVLLSVQAERDEFSDSIQVLLAKIEDLQKKIRYWRGRYGKMAKKVQALEAEIRSLQATIDSLKQENQQLLAAKTQLESALQQEQAKRKNLEKTIEEAQILRAGNVQGMGLRVKGGEEVPTQNASKAKKLKVCFDVFHHPIVNPGTKTAYVRLTDPSQKLFYDKSKGSGVFLDKTHNAEIKYTIKQDFNYSGKDVNLCVVWEKPEDLKKFLPGVYQVEIYVDNYFAGKGEFELRKGLFVK